MPRLSPLLSLAWPRKKKACASESVPIAAAEPPQAITPRAAATSVTNILAGNDFETEEISTLLQALDKGQSLSLHMPSEHLSGLVQAPMPCALIGFDLDQNELLLECRGHEINSLQKGKTCGLQIKSNGFYYRLMLCVETCDSRGDTFLCSAKIIERVITANRRWQPRFQFPIYQGPRVRLQVQHGPAIEAKLSNLSARGACIDCFGRDLREEFTRGQHMRSQIVFNEHFTLNTLNEIVQVSFKRSPCCHTQIRIMFKAMPVEAQAQVINFLACAEAF